MLILRKILNNKTLMKKALRFAARRGRPGIAAQILRAIEIPLIKASTPTPYRILALNVNKDGFLQDVKECFRGAEEFEVFGWPSYALPSIAESILSPKINNDTYMSSDPDIIRSKKEYRAFIGRVCDRLSRLNKLDAALAPNFHYAVQREFSAALEERNLPFIVLHKENLKSPGRVEFWRHMYKRRGTFSGRKILVYNNIERDLQLQVGVTGPERVIVTGMPRLDRIHRWRYNAAARNSTKSHTHDDRPQILFFAFDRLDKLPILRQDISDPGLTERWGELTWTRICEDTHKAVVELARRRPDVRVVIKTKAVERQRKDVDRMLKAAADPLPSNLIVINGGDAFQILTESSIVIGFNTTAQLEAIAAGKPVIVPWFGEAVAQRTSDFVIDLGDAVTYAKSPNELVELAISMVDSAKGEPCEIDAAASQALIHWTGNDDGESGRRVLNIIRHELQ